ncbi:AglZ/HisF2 family acetamidino modification protein [Pseudomonadales bacterium]|nr:AglZ/HisF2 family acetamidino modification protein [Pseudomonadales bacterium]
MIRTRVIPILLLRNESLVKTRKFRDFDYVGDPANTVRIFNELEVDELMFLDITASVEGRQPNLKILKDIASECFMPLGYGGGISSLDEAKQVFDIGFEKISINTAVGRNPRLIEQLSNQYGNQAVVVSIDVKKDILGNQMVWTSGGRKNLRHDPVSWAKEVEMMGAGEILLTSIDREGTWSGFDVELVRRVADAVSIPVVAHGGAGKVEHLRDVVIDGNATAVGLGSLVVYQKKGMGVLVNFPDTRDLDLFIGRSQNEF